MFVPDEIESAMADAKHRRYGSRKAKLFEEHAPPGESEFGKPRGDVSPPTPGRHVPLAPRRISVSHVGPGPGVGRR